MVERAADEKLDGYRELGARAARAENERDDARADAFRLTQLLAVAEAVAREEEREACATLVEFFRGTPEGNRLAGMGLSDWCDGLAAAIRARNESVGAGAAGRAGGAVSTPEQRGAWGKLAEAATLGPWELQTKDWDGTDIQVIVVHTRDGGCAEVLEEPCHFRAYASGAFVTTDGLEANLAFAAAAREAVPALLADVERLEKERDVYREHVEIMTRDLDAAPPQEDVDSWTDVYIKKMHEDGAQILKLRAWVARAVEALEMALRGPFDFDALSAVLRDAPKP